MMNTTTQTDIHDDTKQGLDRDCIRTENVVVLIAIALLIGFLIGFLLHDSILNFNPQHAVWKNSLMETNRK